MNRAGACSALLCITVLAIAAVAACSLAAAAPSANAASGTIRIALPESDVVVQLNADGFCEFTGNDIQHIGQTGEPSIPYQSVRVLLPPNADLATVKAKIAGYRWTAIGGEWDIPPVGPLVTGNGEEASPVWPTGRNIVNGRDADIYESDALFPLEPIRRMDVQVMRQWKMVQILYAPYAYNPVENQVFQLSGSAIEITFERTSLKSISAGADLSSADRVRDMTVNFAQVSGEYGSYAVSSDTGRYVIITTSAIEAASANLDDFVASKEARGFTVQVVTEGTWGGGTGDTAAENLRSWLQANYISLNIKYVLLIGNPNPTTGDVPMKMCYPQDYNAAYPECPTDFYYAELTSNWNGDGDAKYGEYLDDFSDSPPRVAEVAVGRIPCYGSITDLDHILSKTIDYENAPANTISWRENVLLPMEPSDASTPGYQLGEEIKDEVLPVDWNYHRVYDEYNTRYCDPGDPGYVTGIPGDTETKSCTVASVTDAWKSSDFGAVFWWTHGENTSAADVMNSGTAATLDDTHPSFTFQSSCLNGAPETSNNLGYSLLKNGCIATVSASRNSWYEIGQTSFAGSATNSGMAFEYASRLIDEEMYAGDALNDLKWGVLLPPPSEEDRENEVLWMNYLDFNLYGCPAVGLYSSTPEQDSPSVVTYYGKSVTATSARLGANLTSLGTADNVMVSFEWGTTSGVYTDNNTPQVMSTTGTYYFDLGGRDPGVTHYYRAKAAGNGTAYGLEKIFTTLTEPPSVDTNVVTDIGTTWAILNGDLEDLGTADNVSVSFEWGLTTSYDNETPLVSMGEEGGFSDNLTGLTPKTTYHFRAKAVGHGTAYGSGMTFTTLTVPPSVTTNAASNLTFASARLNGNLADVGTASSVTVSFQWGTTPGGPYPDSTGNQVRSSTGAFYTDLGGLTPGTTYYYQSRAVGDGTVYGDEKSFITLSTPPSVATGDVSDIAIDGARLNGILSSLGTAPSVSVSFEWGTVSDNYTYETAAEVKTATGAFYFDLSGLASGTTFYYRAKAVGHGTTHGLEKSFTTGTPPSVTSLGASDRTFTSATLNGDLTLPGGVDNATVCFEWGTVAGGPHPNQTDNQTLTATGPFSAPLVSLTPWTTYYYRAKAHGGAGPVYGDEKSFTTLSTPPLVATSNATNLAMHSATLNGSLTSLGTAASVSISFEWGMESGVYGNETTPVPLSSTGSYSTSLSGLAPGTTFYYRAKAVGHGEPQFGEEMSFATLPAPLPAIDSVAPGSGSIGQSLTVTITGTNFTGVTAVSFGPDVVVGSFSAVSATQINTAIRILCDRAPGMRDVSVTTPGGTATLPGGFSVTDSSPNQPRNTSPADKAGIMTLTPTLGSSAFSHTCPSRTHAASQWQVAAVSGDYSKPVFDSAADTVNLTSITLPRGVLGEPESYWWRVRYRDSSGIWSDWSEETRFTRPDFLRAALDGPAEIHVTDSMSRVTGVVGAQPQQGIPYSDYFNGTVTITSPGDSYGYALVGTEDGAYTLTVVRVIGDQILTFRAAGIPLSAGEIHYYVIDWETLSKGGKSVTIRIDSDGDGAFDKTAFLDGEISTKEFKAAVDGYRTPVWVWILFGLGLVAASLGLYALSRAARHRDQTEVAQ